MPRLSLYLGRGAGGVQKHLVCTYVHSHGGFTAGEANGAKIPLAALRCARAAFARVARCVCAMARAVRARARPCLRVLAGRRERDRVLLRVACVQHDLCKCCAHVQSWQHCAPHGVRRACAPGEAQPVSLILRACAQESGRRGLRRPGQRAGAQRAFWVSTGHGFGGGSLIETKSNLEMISGLHLSFRFQD